MHSQVSVTNWQQGTSYASGLQILKLLNHYMIQWKVYLAVLPILQVLVRLVDQVVLDHLYIVPELDELLVHPSDLYSIIRHINEYRTFCPSLPLIITHTQRHTDTQFLITAQCYAERGYAMANGPSVRL